VIQCVVISVSVTGSCGAECICEEGSDQSMNPSFIQSTLTKFSCDVTEIASEANYELC
jgi:hypothetical protein